MKRTYKKPVVEILTCQLDESIMQASAGNSMGIIDGTEVSTGDVLSNEEWNNQIW